MTSLCKSTKISDYKQYNWTLNETETIKYPEIINFERAGTKGEHHCVMCGTRKGPECVIPNQNKDVCKTCDSSFWLLHNLNVLVKFCKGCKKFSALQDFDEKPEASKCGKCRRRGRQNYYSRKQDEDDVGLGGMNKKTASVSSLGSDQAVEGKIKDQQKKTLNAVPKPKKDTKRATKNPVQVNGNGNINGTNTGNGMILNKKTLQNLQKNNMMNDSGETDQSSSTLNVTSSTSSESCSSPISYSITSNQNQQHYQYQHQNINHYHHPNHSFSSPSFNDTSELDILGFHPYDTSTETDTDMDHDTNSSKHTSGATRNALQIPFPHRPLTDSTQPSLNASHPPTHPFKINTPSRSSSNSNDKGNVHNAVCPDSASSVVSCSSQISDSGGPYFSNSYLWPDSLKEMERNSLRDQSNVNTREAGRVEGDSHLPVSSHTLVNNPMSCFQLPTGYPSSAKKSNITTNTAGAGALSGGGTMKGVGYGYPPDRGGSSSCSGTSGGVALDRRDSRDSGKSSSSSSKNSSLSSIGSAGAFAMNQFGDLGGMSNMGIINQANTPGLLLSITPQSGGLSFTPHGPGVGGSSSYDVITPFSGTPMFSHSPFDSINTPDSNWKWDPSANALMNLASLSAEVLTNTPPAEELQCFSPDHTAAASTSTTTGAASGVVAGVENEAATVKVAKRKCNSDPCKSTTCTTEHFASTLPPPSGLLENIQESMNNREESNLVSISADTRTSVMPEIQQQQKEHIQMPTVNNSQTQGLSVRPSCNTDDNIYQIALDSSQSFELSPPIPVDKKRSFKQLNESKSDDNDNEQEEAIFASASFLHNNDSSPQDLSTLTGSLFSSTADNNNVEAPIPVKKLRL